MLRVIVTGSYGTGSSAVTDLLSEYDGVRYAVGSRYEHMHLLCQHGLFELETRLYGDSANYITRDRALSDFYDVMKAFNDYDYGWFGSYRALFGDAFWDATREFLDKLCYGVKRSSIAHTRRTRFSLWKCVLQLGARILLGRKVSKWGRVYVTDASLSRFLTASHEEFMAAARAYVDAYFRLCEKDGGEIWLYDHMLLASQTALADRFFGEDTKVIVVVRDPADVWLSDKYVWSKAGVCGQRGPMPYEIDAYCRFTRLNEEGRIAGTGSERVLCVRFEDLVYRYDETKAEIEAFVGLSPERHAKPKTEFDPAQSVKNTQIVRRNPEFRAEYDYIAERLSEFMYDFPYEVDYSIKDVFDK